LSKKEYKKISRVLIVGYGSIGVKHASVAKEILPHAKIKFLRQSKSNNIKDPGHEFIKDINEVNEFRPDIAIIANPATFHIEVAQDLAEQGIHMIIEKPLSVSSTGIKKLESIVEKNNIVALIGYNLRFSESLEFLKQQINDGFIGKILSVRCETGQYLPTWRPDTNYIDSVSAKSKLGGGVLLELSHELDYLRWIFGDIQWVISALLRQSNLKIDVEDSAHIIMGFKKNVNNSNLVASINLDFIRQDKKRLLTVIGEKGTLLWDGIVNNVVFINENGEEPNEIFKEKASDNDSYFKEWIHFLDSILENKPTKITIKDGMQVMNIVEAIRKSAKTDKKEYI